MLRRPRPWWDGSVLAEARSAVPRPLWWDGGLAAGIAVVGVLTILVHPFSLVYEIVPGTHWARMGVAALLCVLEVWRTRQPVAALVAAVAVGAADLSLGLSVVGALVVADLLYCAVLHGSVRAAQIVQSCAFASWALLMVLLLVSAPSIDMALRQALPSSALLLMPVLWARDVRHRANETVAERAAAEQAARIAELDRGATLADERTRIARDLHDSIAGHLSAIALQSQAAQRADDRTRDRVLQAVRENSIRSLEEMRVLIELLHRSGTGDALDGAPAASRLSELPTLIESARTAGLVVRESVGDLSGVPAAVDLTAYRIVQEALTNAARHAPGATVGVRIDVADGALSVEVVNDRPGAPPSPGNGTGIDGIGLRAAAVGGTATAGPDGDRWRVHARLPIGAKP